MAHISKRTKALRTKVDRDKTYPVADAIKLSDTTYCSVAATVRPTAEITTSYEIIEVGP